MTIYSLDVLLFPFGTSLLFHNANSKDPFLAIILHSLSAAFAVIYHSHLEINLLVVSSLHFQDSMLSFFFFFFFLTNCLLFKGPLVIFILYSILCDHWTASRHNPRSFIFYLCLLMNSPSLKALNNSSLFIVVSPP